jgi:hypothetical protein
VMSTQQERGLGAASKCVGAGGRCGGTGTTARNVHDGG